jgi:GxxExxY protein
LTHKVIGAAFEVDKALGPGFLEKVYVNALLRELQEASVTAKAELPIPVSYKGIEVGMYYADLLVEDTLICEVKATRSLLREHEAQLLIT